MLGVDCAQSGLPNPDHAPDESGQADLSDLAIRQEARTFRIGSKYKTQRPQEAGNSEE